MTPAPQDRARRVTLDVKYGPAPSTRAKFKDAAKFVEKYRAYQWTQGFDVTVEGESPYHVTLVCATHANCDFKVVAEKIIFDDGPIAGQVGYQVASNPLDPGLPRKFVTQHNHAAPYFPLDLNEENERRKELSPTDPSLQHPPLKIIDAAITVVTGETLETFLPTIHPLVGSEETLKHLDVHGIPRDTPTSELLDLDDGVYELFEEVPGLSVFVPALIQDGVLRAKARREKGATDYDGGEDRDSLAQAQDFVRRAISADAELST